MEGQLKSGLTDKQITYISINNQKSQLHPAINDIKTVNQNQEMTLWDTLGQLGHLLARQPAAGQGHRNIV
jgi:hypothetical protein